MLTDAQLNLAHAPLNARVFLSGPAGSGKTTAGVERLRILLGANIPADSILVLTPQRTLQAPYEQSSRDPNLLPGGQLTMLTVGGLARRLVDLFWPIAAELAGFAHPDQPPVFLTLETAQYHMARIVRPLLEQGYFASLTMDRNRLYSQVLDNLNKAATVGFHYSEIGERLSAAWVGDPAQRRVYGDAQDCATRFRQHCLQNNLLDFSLQMDILSTHLWHLPLCRDFLHHQYHHLICDNLEEDVPVTHDLLLGWIPEFESALLIHDTQAGYRRFLGADPDSALRLRELCDTRVELDESFVTTPVVRSLASAFTSRLIPGPPVPTDPQAFDILTFPSASTPSRFYPQMLDWVTREIHELVVGQQVPPSEIVVLAPFLSDALRFSLSHRLEEFGLPWHSHRPSRSLRDEPACKCLLTFAALAHPGWGLHPSKFDVAYAFMFAIEDMDLVRAQLLAEIVFRARDISLSSFSAIRSEVQGRITYVFGQRYQALLEWITAYHQQAEPDPLDHFLRRIFGEVLSQKGFGFHRNQDAARTAASLVESVFKFRQAMKTPASGEAGGGEPGEPALGREYLDMLQDGVISAQYLEAWQPPPAEAILLAPAHTFLMTNQPVRIQFWLDVGSSGWWERLFQPLTQPYVLSRAWQPNRPWTDADEISTNQQTLNCLITGLLRRCRERVYLGVSDLGESGFEQRGPLLKAIWKMQLDLQRQNEF